MNTHKFIGLNPKNLQVLLPHIPSPQEGNPHPKWKKKKKKKASSTLICSTSLGA
jgi:hypothetical protein